jgi:hypothetical protein
LKLEALAVVIAAGSREKVQGRKGLRQDTLIIIVTIIIISVSFRKYLSNIPGKKIKDVQKTAILGTAHIFRTVLILSTVH